MDTRGCVDQVLGVFAKQESSQEREVTVTLNTDMPLNVYHCVKTTHLVLNIDTAPGVAPGPDPGPGDRVLHQSVAAHHRQGPGQVRVSVRCQPREPVHTDISLLKLLPDPQPERVQLFSGA